MSAVRRAPPSIVDTLAWLRSKRPGLDSPSVDIVLGRVEGLLLDIQVPQIQQEVERAIGFYMFGTEYLTRHVMPNPQHIATTQTQMSAAFTVWNGFWSSAAPGSANAGWTQTKKGT